MRDKARKAYGVISPPDAPSDVAGGKRAEAWLTLILSAALFVGSAWGAVSLLLWAINAPWTPLVPLAWFGVAVLAVFALVTGAFAAIVVIGGPLARKAS